MKSRSMLTPIITVLWLAVAGLAPAQVCDLSEQDTIAAPGSLGQAVILGSSSYVAAGSGGVVRIDVADPANLNVVSFTSTPGEALGIGLDYLRNLLVVADGAAGVGVYQVDGSTGDVSETATTSLGERIISISGASGRFYAGSELGTLYAVAVAAGTAPTVTGSLGLGGQVVATTQRSSVLYCALGTANSIALVDASNGAALTLLETIPMGGEVTAIARSGSSLLVAVAGTGIATFTIDGNQLVAGETLALDHVATSIFEWDQRIYAAGPELGIVVADASLGQGFLQLANYPLADARELSLSGNSLLVSRGASGYTSLDISACDSAGDSQTTYFIPAAARAVGTANTYWVTDVAIANFTSGVATFNLAYLPQGSDNSAPLSTSMAIGAGHQMILADVLESAFGLESGNGGLRVVTSDVDVKITSRTYNAAGSEGTYGQFIPALTDSSAMAPGVTGTILQMRENAGANGFRTNLGMVNLTGHDIQTRVRLYDSEGELLGTLSDADTLLRPYEMKQVNRVYNKVGVSELASGYALVTVTSDGAKALFYASVVDNGSGDPIYIPTQALEANFN